MSVVACTDEWAPLAANGYLQVCEWAHLTVFQNDASDSRIGMRPSQASFSKLQSMLHVYPVPAADGTCWPDGLSHQRKTLNRCALSFQSKLRLKNELIVLM